MNIKEALKKSVRNCIRLRINGEADEKAGASRFGGRPDVPEGFEWACCNSGPLSFLAQFDMEELSSFDTEGLLPKTGLLSFFFELTACPRFDDISKECAKVYWFEDKSALRAAEFPDGLSEERRLPPMRVCACAEKSYQSYPDFLLQRPKMVEYWDEFDEIRKKLTDGLDEDGGITKLLGHADPILGNMTKKLELSRRGYDVNDEEIKVSARDEQESEQWANRDQVLLFQVDSMKSGELELSFGKNGRLYFYIYRGDLESKDFSKVRAVLQSL